MKHNNNKALKARIAVLVALAGLLVLLIAIASATAPIARTTKAQTYDVNCLTEPRRNPLQECKK